MAPAPPVAIQPLTVQRLEAAEAALACLLDGGAGLPAMGGYAAYVSPDSPLTHVVGAGVGRTVTLADLGAVETFYAERGAETVFELSPMVDPLLLSLLQGRGYRVGQFENSLVLNLATAPAIPPHPVAAAAQVRRAEPDEAPQWARLVGEGFFSRTELSNDELAIGKPFAERAWAYVAEIAGRPAATAALWLHEEIAFFVTDSTLPVYRGQGLQQLLIQRRLDDAVAAGARYAVVGTAVNSVSQTNYLRHGFRVLYTKFTMSRS